MPPAIPSLPGQGFRTDLEGRCHWLTDWMTFWRASSFLGLPSQHQLSWTLKGSHALLFLRWGTQLQLILNVATVTKTVIQCASQQMQEVTQHWQLNHGSCKHSLQWKHKKQITLVTAWIGFRQIKVCWTCQGWALSQQAEHCHRKCINLLSEICTTQTSAIQHTKHLIHWPGKARWDGFSAKNRGGFHWVADRHSE